MLTLSKVHEYSRINDGSRATLTRVNPYIVMSRGNGEGSVRVFIQGGQFYHEKGEEFSKDALPPWVNDEIAKMTPAARKEAGLQDWKPPKP
jgi:hypothetical protein